MVFFKFWPCAFGHVHLFLGVVCQKVCSLDFNKVPIGAELGTGGMQRFSFFLKANKQMKLTKEDLCKYLYSFLLENILFGSFTSVNERASLHSKAPGWALIHKKRSGRSYCGETSDSCFRNCSSSFKKKTKPMSGAKNQDHRFKFQFRKCITQAYVQESDQLMVSIKLAWNKS